MKKLVFLLLLITAYSCSKEHEEEKEEVVATAEPIIINPDKNQYAPYEIVSITSSAGLFTLKSFKAEINDTQIVIGSNENVASFVLPKLANGNYQLSFIMDSKNYTVPIKVTSLSNI